MSKAHRFTKLQPRLLAVAAPLVVFSAAAWATPSDSGALARDPERLAALFSSFEAGESGVVGEPGLVAVDDEQQRDPKGRPATGRKANRPRRGGATPEADKGKPVEIPDDIQRRVEEFLDQENKAGDPPDKGAEKDAAKGADRVNRPRRTPSRPGRTPGAENAGGEEIDVTQRPSRRTPPRTPPRTPRNSQLGRPNAGQAGNPQVNQPRGQAGDAGEGPEGPITQIDMPPAEDIVPAEAKLYSFSLKDVTYEQLLAGLNRQTGLAILGEAPQDGKVSFETTEQLTFDELIRRVRMLLFNYKPHDPYWLIREDMNLRVIRIADFYRQLPIEKMYKSLEKYREADLPEDEVVLVIFTPSEGTIHGLDMIPHFMPDYVRISPVGENTNTISIFALVKHIEKYLALVDIFSADTEDIRKLEVVPVENVTASEAWASIQTLMELDDGSARPRAPRGRRQTNDASALESMPEPPVSVVPEDSQGVLIIRAMQNKIDEIKMLLAVVDVDTSSEFKPEVIHLEYVLANDVIPVIEEILQASSGGEAPDKPRRPRRRGRKTTGDPASATADGTTLIAHPDNRAIIVMGDEAAVAEVRRLVKEFDRKSDVAPRFIALSFVDPTELVATLTQVVGGGEKGKGAAAQRFTVVPDPNGAGIWFTGPKSDLETIMDIVKAVDEEGGAVTLHVVRLENRMPSFVVQVLTQVDGNEASAGTSSKRRRPRRGRRASSAASGGAQAGKFTPDDENMRLFILCTEDEWSTYQPIIKMLEEEVEGPEPEFVVLPVLHISPEEAMAKLQTLVSAPSEGGQRGVPSSIRYEATADAVIVSGATHDQVKQMRDLLEVFDVESSIIQRTFTIKYASPEAVYGALQAMLSGGDVSPSGRRRAGKAAPDAAGGSDVTIVPIGNRLFVTATPARMQEVEELIAQFDVEEDVTEMRIFDDFPPTADVEAIAEDLRGFMLTGTHTIRKKDEPASGPQIVAQPDAGRILVVATKADLQEIEELIGVLRTEPVVPVFLTEFVPVHFADPAEVVELVTPVLEMRTAQLEAEGKLVGEVATSEAGGTGRKIRRMAQKAAGNTPEWFHMEADVRKRRIVITAPQVVIEHAVALIEKFDDQGDEDAVVDRIIELHNSSADAMVKSIRDLMMNRSRAPRGPRGAADKAGDLATADFSIIEAPNNRAVMLRGAEEMVDQAAMWIEQLDGLPGPNRVIKVYRIDCADTRQVTDFIWAMVGQAEQPAVKGRRPRRTRLPQQDEDEDVFETKLKRTGDNIYLEADLISDVLIVATTADKHSEVKALVDQFNQCEDEGEFIPPAAIVPKFTYELEHVDDAIDAAFQLEMVLDDLWTREEKPRVDAAIWSNALVVEYPREDEFDEIRRMIQKYVDKPDPDAKKKKRSVLTLPEGFEMEAFIEMLKDQNPHLKFNTQDLTEKKESDYPIERLLPKTVGKRNDRTSRNDAGGVKPCVLPLGAASMLQRMNAMLVSLEGARVVAGAALGAVQQDPAGQPEPSKTPPPDDERGRDHDDDRDIEPDEVDDYPDDIQLPPQRTQVPQDDKPVDDKPQDDKPIKRFDVDAAAIGPEVTIYYDAETRRIVVEGLETQLDDVEEAYKLLKEESEKGIDAPPDIRVYRVRYIDVYTAKDVIEEMFNATRQQRMNVQQQMARLRQQQARQRQQQRRQQQQQQQQNQDDPRRRQQQQQEQNEVQQPQLPPTSVRVYANARDRTLILRADSSQYPALLEMLSIIDQPQPVESTFKTFVLDKLNAVEVESLLEDFLGIDAPASRRRRGTPSRNTRRGAASAGGDMEPGPQLPQSIMTANELSVDPTDIKISSNEEANTLLVMAPQEAIDFIGELIEQLESQNIPDREWQTFSLEHADAMEVVEYLENYFGEGQGGGRRGARRGGNEGGASLGSRPLNAPTFVAYGRLNLVSAQGTEEQLAEIDKQISMLDISGEANDWQTISLARNDAKVVAEQLTSMFGGSTGGRGQRGGDDSGNTPKFVGNEGGKMVFFTAPETLREEIEKVVKQMEEDAVDQSRPKIIELKFAKPSTVAEAITEAYGSGSGGGRRGRGSSTPFNVTGHDPSRKLFVVADEETFKEISSLATSLDQPPTPGFDFRIFPLQHANARKVYEQLSSLMREYLQRAGGRGASVEPFSVEVDDRANALIVLGSPAVFGFLEENIAKIDTPANAASPPSSLIVALKNASAQEVAQNISQLWTTKSLPPGETPPQAQANRSTNTIIVRGTQAQIDEIKRDLIDPLEENKPPTLETETFVLEHAQPEAVAESINKIFQDKAEAIRRLGREANVAPLEFTVIATPDVNTGQVIVQAGKSNLDLVRARIEELDRPENAVSSAVSMRVYPLKFAEPGSVANIITQWSRSRSQNRNVSASEMITAVAESGSRSVVVTASESNQQIVTEMIQSLDDEKIATQQRAFRVIALSHANASTLASHCNQIFRNSATLRRGDRGPSFEADPSTNSLLASVNDEEFDEVRALVAELDVPPPSDSQRITEVYPLTYADPGSLNNVVLNMFRWDRPGQAAPSEQVTCAPEWSTRSLIITASPKNHAVVKAMIEQADVESALTKEDFVYPLKNANAEMVANTLRQALQGRRRTGRGEAPVQVVADAATNKLVISATQQEYEELLSLIESLDTEEAIANEVRVVSLSFGDASEMQRALQDTLRSSGGRGQEMVGGVRVSALPQGNSLVLSGPPNQLDNLESKVREMDEAGAQGAVPKFVRLKHAKISRVMPVLEEMFGEQRRGRRNQQQPTFSAVDGANGIFVKADPTDMSAIEAVIDGLDTEELQEQQAFRLVSVASGYSVTDLAAKVEETINNGVEATQAGGGRRGGRGNVPSISVTGDTRNNHLIISGDPTLFDDAEQLAGQLAVAKSNMKRTIRIIDDPKIDADDLSRLLEQLTQGSTSGSSDRSRRGNRDNRRGNRGGGRRGR